MHRIFHTITNFFDQEKKNVENYCVKNRTPGTADHLLIFYSGLLEAISGRNGFNPHTITYKLTPDLNKSLLTEREIPL
jgi:hypothetical protein